jgi:hypothetical protein
MRRIVVDQPLIQAYGRVVMVIEYGGAGLPVEHLWEQGGAWVTRLEVTPQAFSSSVARLTILLPPRLPEALTRRVCRRSLVHQTLIKFLRPERHLLSAVLHHSQGHRRVSGPRQE